MRRYVAGLVFMCLLAHAPAAAQERGKVGITMGFPASVGLLWHVSEKVAVRPELALSFGSTEGAIEIDSHSVSTGVSALFYFKQWQNLATYVTPRYAFNQSTTESRGLFGADRESSTNTHLVSGSFGAQYWLGERFSAFGEVGFSYQHGSSEDNAELPFDAQVTSTSFGTRSSVGLVFYF